MLSVLFPKIDDAYEECEARARGLETMIVDTVHSCQVIEISRPSHHRNIRSWLRIVLIYVMSIDISYLI